MQVELGFKSDYAYNFILLLKTKCKYLTKLFVLFSDHVFNANQAVTAEDRHFLLAAGSLNCKLLSFMQRLCMNSERSSTGMRDN